MSGAQPVELNRRRPTIPSSPHSHLAVISLPLGVSRDKDLSSPFLASVLQVLCRSIMPYSREGRLQYGQIHPVDVDPSVYREP